MVVRGCRLDDELKVGASLRSQKTINCNLCSFLLDLKFLCIKLCSECTHTNLLTISHLQIYPSEEYNMPRAFFLMNLCLSSHMSAYTGSFPLLGGIYISSYFNLSRYKIKLRILDHKSDLDAHCRRSRWSSLT